MLRGYDKDYHKDDILKHINMLKVPGESLLKYFVGSDSDRDENDIKIPFFQSSSQTPLFIPVKFCVAVSRMG